MATIFILRVEGEEIHGEFESLRKHTEVYNIFGVT